MNRNLFPESSFSQFVKYGIAGTIATLVQVLFFYALAWKVFPALHTDDPVVRLLRLQVSHISNAVRAVNSMLCNAVAFLCSNTTAYLINISWVFKSGRHRRFVEVGLFYLVGGSSVAVGTFVMGVMINYFGIHTTIAFFVNVGICLLINYGFRKFLVFKG